METATQAHALVRRPMPPPAGFATGAQAVDANGQAVPAVLPKDYVPAAESAHELYQISTEAFRGPLDLLLFLIKRHQLDVFDIPMAFVCVRYLGYLEMMRECNLDVAAEFMFMASELLHIKSRMLLPQEHKTAEELEEGDPRAELVERLLTLQSFKDAATDLGSRDQLGRDVFTHTPQVPAKGLDKLKPVDSWALVGAFDGLLKRLKPEVRHKVVVEQVPMRLRMYRLIEWLDGCAEAKAFAEVLEDIEARVDLIVTFLAVLEMTKLKLLRVYQSEDGALYVLARFANASEAHQSLAHSQPVDDFT